MTAQEVDPQRAETYLRLQAETELRRALAFSRLHPPAERAATTTLRRAAAQLIRLVPAALRRAARTSLARRVPAVRVGLAAVPWIAAALWSPVRSRAEPQPDVRACLARVQTLGRALATVGAVPVATSAAVTHDLRTALVTRGLLAAWELGRLPDPPQPAPAHPPGRLRAVPVGVTVTREMQGTPVRLCLGAFAADDTRAQLSVQARFDPPLAGGTALLSSMQRVLFSSVAVDDRGTPYPACFHGPGSAGHFEGVFELSPAPPAGTRWLDLTVPGAAPVRVPLDSTRPELPVTASALDPREAADRYVDDRTTDLLRSGRSAGADHHAVLAVATGLLGAGVLHPASPSLRRLAAAARRRRWPLPRPLAQVQHAGPRADRLGLLPRRGLRRGRRGVVPVAAVTPEIDGVRCTYLELVSAPKSALLQVHLHGWPNPSDHGLPGEAPYRWTARDDVGSVHVTDHEGWYYEHGGQADHGLRLRPPISPRARELTITLTGRTAQASVTVPLDWQEGP